MFGRRNNKSSCQRNMDKWLFPATPGSEFTLAHDYWGMVSSMRSLKNEK
jgi:hypothetical protein